MIKTVGTVFVLHTCFTCLHNHTLTTIVYVLNTAMIRCVRMETINCGIKNYYGAIDIFLLHVLDWWLRAPGLARVSASAVDSEVVWAAIIVLPFYRD